MLIAPIPKRLGTWIILGAALLPSSARPARRILRAELALAPPGSVVLLGERHRRSEGHRLFLELVADAVQKGDRVRVGLEVPAGRQGALDAVLRGERSPEELAHPIIDCPSYRALLVGLGELARESDARLAVRAVDAPSRSTRPREPAMARQVLAAVRSGPYDRVAILVGNLHALKAVPWSPAAAGVRVRAWPSC